MNEFSNICENGLKESIEGKFFFEALENQLSTVGITQRTTGFISIARLWTASTHAAHLAGLHRATAVD